MTSNSLITISHYNKRDKSNLYDLSTKLKKQNSDLFIVINDDICQMETLGKFNNIKSLTRQNSGMNIGSWNSSYLNNRHYDYYLFLQDECKIINNSFLANYINDWQKSSNVINLNTCQSILNFEG